MNKDYLFPTLTIILSIALILSILFPVTCFAETRIGGIWATPLEQGVGGSGIRFEHKKDDYYVALDVVNMRYGSKAFIGVQPFLYAGKQFDFSLWKLKPFARLGLGVSKPNESISGYFRINTALGLRFKNFACMWDHGSTAGATHRNRGEDMIVCSAGVKL